MFEAIKALGVIVFVLLAMIPMSIAAFFVCLYEKIACSLGRHDVSTRGITGSLFAQDRCNRCDVVWPHSIRGVVNEMQFFQKESKDLSPYFALTALSNRFRYGEETISRDVLVDFLNETKDNIGKML